MPTAFWRTDWLVNFRAIESVGTPSAVIPAGSSEAGTANFSGS